MSQFIEYLAVATIQAVITIKYFIILLIVIYVNDVYFKSSEKSGVNYVSADVRCIESEAQLCTMLKLLGCQGCNGVSIVLGCHKTKLYLVSC